MSNAASFAETPGPPRAAWEAARISDDAYRTKFTYLPQIILDWTTEHGGLAGRDVLDYRCGDATAALGIALQHEPRLVDAVDVVDNFEACAPLAAAQLGLTELPPNLRLRKAPRDGLLDGDDRYDVIYSWSAIELVEQTMLPRILQSLRAALKPGGLLLLQTASLFYSMDGANLMPWVSEPWGHLLNQHSIYLDKLAAACAGTDEFNRLQTMFEALNRLTADQLVAHARAAGFDVLREHRTNHDAPVPPGLDLIFQPQILLNNQIVLLLRPASNAATEDPLDSASELLAEELSS